MTLVSLQEIGKAYGKKTILERLSVTIEDRDRIGLIGVNGSGKSTLIRIILGSEPPDSGQVQRRRGLLSRLVEQFPKLDQTQTVRAAVLEGLQRHQATERRIAEIQNELEHAHESSQTERLIEELGALSALLDQAGWHQEHHAEAVMAALGVPDPERLIGSLSVGETRRVALCQAFLERPELLVLDEPTNHLDVQAIEWLEGRLAEWSGALILVTHDRYFLDRVANRQFELDRGDLRVYEGNYSEYLVSRAERDALDAKLEHRRHRAIESELEWVRKSAPARTTKQKARLDRFDVLVSARPKAALGEVRFRLPHPPRTGKTLLELKGITKKIGARRLISNLDLILTRGSRIGIVGPNGAGKTTLLRIIRNEIKPDAGEVIVGVNTQIAYADQSRTDLDDTKSVLEEVAGESDRVFVGDEALSVHSFLEGLLFDSASIRTPISALSGGERSRVALAKALRVAANLIILDEPTNDLDLPTLRVLEEALVEYPGSALIVSHDRYFLDRVTTAILAFEGDGRVVLYEGSHVLYRERKEQQLASLSALAAETSGPSRSSSSSVDEKKSAVRSANRSYREETEFASMEAEILKSESEVGDLEAVLSDPEAFKNLGGEVKTRMNELEALKKRVEHLYERWAELSAKKPYGS